VSLALANPTCAEKLWDSQAQGQDYGWVGPSVLRESTKTIRECAEEVTVTKSVGCRQQLTQRAMRNEPESLFGFRKRSLLFIGSNDAAGKVIETHEHAGDFKETSRNYARQRY
jgi:hypothetical protein